MAAATAIDNRGGGENTSSKAPRRRGRKGLEHQDVSASFHKNTGNGASTTGNYKPHQSLLINLTEETPTWYDCGRHTELRDDTIFTVTSSQEASNTTSTTQNKQSKRKTNSYQVVTKYRSMGDTILQQELSLFRNNSSAESGKDEQWLDATMKRGTLKDRIAAMSVGVSSHPVHKLYALDMLLHLAGVSSNESKKGESSNQSNQRVTQMASEALMDLFIHSLLPTHRKLVSLDQRPLFLFEENAQGNDTSIQKGSKKKHATKRTLSPRILLLWRYEEILKNKYSAFLQQYLGRTLAQNATQGVLDMTKIMALKTACTLLREVPEGEQALLGMVVNKIGDPTKKIAAAAGHELRNMLEVHPNMTKIVAREVQQLAYRPNLSSKALYNCIIFLNQLKLVREEEEDYDVKSDAKTKQGKALSLPASLINTYFQLFEVTVKKGQSTKKDKKKKKSKEAVTHSNAMRSRLLGALLTGVNRAHPYLSSKDMGMEEHIDALYRISHVSPPSVCTQALMLLLHLAVGSSSSMTNHYKKNTVKATTDMNEVETKRMDRFYRALYSKLSDTDMFCGKQVTLFFNLIFKAMKNDSNTLRVVAFAKRLVDTACHLTPAILAGSLFLVSEVMKHQPSLHDAVVESEGNTVTYDALKREPSAAFFIQTSANSDDSEHESDGNGEAEETDNGEAKEEKDNDKVESVTSTRPGSIWELALSQHHYHPTVQKFTSSMGDISYRGDPLKDFTLQPFLDKFAFRNPKSSEKIKKHFRRGESVGERRNGLQGGIRAMSSLPVNDPKFWEKQGDNVPETDEFFRRYFVEREKRDEMKGVSRTTDEKGETDEIQDQIEAKEGDDVDFDWDTDSDEEAFVQGLAEKLMDDYEGNKANLDEEDPDMDDWSDVDESDEDGDGEKEPIDFSKFDGFNDEDIEGMDSSDDDDDDEQGGDLDSADEDVDPFGGENSDDDSMQDEMDLAFANDDEDSDNSEAEEAEESNQTKKSKEKKISSSFADASEYEEIMAKGLKRKDTTQEHDESDNRPKKKKSKKRKKRNLN